MRPETPDYSRGLASLSEIAGLVADDPDLASFPERLCATVARLVGAERVAIFGLGPGGTLDAQPGSFGMAPELIAQLRGIPCHPDGEGIVDLVVYHDRVFRAGIDDSAPEAAPYLHWLRMLRARNALGVGWRAGSRRLGAIVAYDSVARDGFTEADEWVAQVASMAAGLVWQQSRLTAELVQVQAEETAHAQALAERMSALERSKSDLLNLAAHELRGPLAVVRGYLAMIEEGSLTGQALNRILPTLVGKAGQMDFLVTQMLEAARLEEGLLKLNNRPFDLGQVVRRTVDTTGLLAPSGQWVLYIQPPAPVLINGDPERVATIVANLLDNAIKYSPQGGPVNCSVRIQDETALVKVVDRGLGIAPDDLERLFTRFGRILTPENSHIPGTGLGLHICRSLARMHGGDITVESELGRGSAFTLRLPLAAGEL